MMELSEVSLEFIECANWKKKWKKVFESKGSWCKRWWTDWSKVKTIEFCNNNRNWLVPDLFDFWLQCLLPNYKLRVDYYIWSAKLGSSFWFQIDYTLVYCLFWCEKQHSMGTVFRCQRMWNIGYLYRLMFSSNMIT